MARKLTNTDLEKFRQLLILIRGEITGDIDKLEEDAFGINGEKASVDVKADAGSDSYYQEFSLELLERDESTLREVERALVRIDEGTYGRCQECDCWIPKTRRKSVPHARNCVDCQRSLEQEG